jgi:hypothetical protein
MVNLAKDNPYPILIQGILIFYDFNLRRAESGLTTIGIFLLHNIDNMDLREVSIVEWHFTWKNI